MAFNQQYQSGKIQSAELDLTKIYGSKQNAAIGENAIKITEKNTSWRSDDLTYTIQGNGVVLIYNHGIPIGYTNLDALMDVAEASNTEIETTVSDLTDQGFPSSTNSGQAGSVSIETPEDNLDEEDELSDVPNIENIDDDETIGETEYQEEETEVVEETPEVQQEDEVVSETEYQEDEEAEADLEDKPEIEQDSTENSFPSKFEDWTQEDCAARLKEKGFSQDWINKYMDMCATHGIEPRELLGLMSTECGLNGSASNGTYTGYMQMSEYWFGLAGTSKAGYLAMSDYDKLSVIDKHLTNLENYCGIGRGAPIEDYYAANFLSGRADHEILTDTSEEYYWSNEGLDYDGNGNISKQDLKNTIISKFYEHMIN